MGKRNKPKFYAVARGRVPGVYTTWEECEPQVKSFGGAKYKSFPTSAAAHGYIDNESGGVAAAARHHPQQATAAARSTSAAVQSTQIGSGGTGSGGHGSTAAWQERQQQAPSTRPQAVGDSDMVRQAREFASKWVKATGESTCASTPPGVDRPGLRPPGLLRCA
jgi:hypothetical protein